MLNAELCLTHIVVRHSFSAGSSIYFVFFGRTYIGNNLLFYQSCCRLMKWRSQSCSKCVFNIIHVYGPHIIYSSSKHSCQLNWNIIGHKINHKDMCSLCAWYKHSSSLQKGPRKPTKYQFCADFNDLRLIGFSEIKNKEVTKYSILIFSN